MPLTKQGKIELLETFIQNEYWIGLYSNNESPLSGNLLELSNTTTLDTIVGFEFTDKIEYARKKIDISDWVQDTPNLKVSTSKSFSTMLEDWSNIQGYFICTCERGTEGDLIYIYSYGYPDYATIIKNVTTLTLEPTIYI